MKDKIYVATGKTESGDDFVIGYWTYEPTEDEVSLATVNKLTWELNAYGIDLEWARENPVEACEEALLYPNVTMLSKVVSEEKRL